MSMPFKVFTCDHCDFSASGTIIWGRFCYQLAEGSLVDIERRAEWCFNCKSIAPIEELDQIGAMDEPKAPERRTEPDTRAVGEYQVS